MALSKKDQEFYETKLDLASFSYVFAATCAIGTIGCPLMLYIQDWSGGDTSKWSSGVAINLAVEGFLLGSVVSVLMYLAFKFLLEMGWLPKRR